MGTVKIVMKKIDKITGRPIITKDAIIKNAEELSITSDIAQLHSTGSAIFPTLSRLNDESEGLVNLSADKQERRTYETFPILAELRDSQGDLSEIATEKSEKIAKNASRKLLEFKEPPRQQCDLSADIARANRRNRRLQRSTTRSTNLGSALFPSLPKFSPQFMRSLNKNQRPLNFPAARYRDLGPTRNSSSPAIRPPIEPVPKFFSKNQPPLDRHLRAAVRPYLPPEQSTFIRIKPPRLRSGDENRPLSSESSSPLKPDC